MLIRTYQVIYRANHRVKYRVKYRLIREEDLLATRAGAGVASKEGGQGMGGGQPTGGQLSTGSYSPLIYCYNTQNNILYIIQ